jgi:hypothetical protein
MLIISMICATNPGTSALVPASIVKAQYRFVAHGGPNQNRGGGTGGSGRPHRRLSEVETKNSTPQGVPQSPRFTRACSTRFGESSGASQTWRSSENRKDNHIINIIATAPMGIKMNVSMLYFFSSSEPVHCKPIDNPCTSQTNNNSNQ